MSNTFQEEDDLTCPMGWLAVAPGVSFNAPQRLMLGWLTQSSAFTKSSIHPNVNPFPLQTNYQPSSNEAICVWTGVSA